MDTIQYCPQSRKNKHLNSYERGQITLLANDGLSPYAIAKRINRSPNTIRAELLRGSVSQIKNGNLGSTPLKWSNVYDPHSFAALLVI